MEQRRAKRKTKSNNYIVIFFIILIILAVALYFIFGNKDKNKNENTNTPDIGEVKTNDSNTGDVEKPIDKESSSLPEGINVDYNIKGDEKLTKVSDTSSFSTKGVKLVTTETETVPNLAVDFKHYTTDTLKEGVSVDKACTFYDETVFFGDSITLGLGNYLKKSSSPKLGNITVLGTGSYGVGNALMDVASDSIHPKYKGEQVQIWNYAKLLGAKKIFMMFGMNDVKRFGVLDSISDYENLIEKIREENPGIDIYILSCTHRTKAAEINRFDKTTFTWFNKLLRENAKKWEVGYIDVASYLLDDEGCLKTSYASDGEYHLNETAYKIVINVLRSYASYHI